MQSEKLKTERLQDVSVFDGFIKAYHDGVFGKKGYFLSLDQLRNDDYQINFGVDNDSEKQKMETPSYYLSEANKVVREIRSLLSKMEKEING
jgi:hypothetical protein